jgi:hypothetical protein
MSPPPRAPLKPLRGLLESNHRAHFPFWGESIQ